MTTPASTSFCGTHGVSEMPMAGSSVPWNTMAPVTLPKASVSLCLRIHRMLLTFSGNSVASGTIISDNSRAEMPSIGAACSTPWMKPSAPSTSRPRPSAELEHDGEQVGGHADLGQEHRFACLGAVAVLHQGSRGAQGEHDVDEINQHHDERQQHARICGFVRHEQRNAGQRKGRQEEIQVAREAGGLRGERALHAALFQHRHADQEQRQCGQHQRRAENGTDADFLVDLDVLRAGENRQQRHHGFRQRGADGGKHRAGHAFGDFQLFAQVLESVDEHFRGDQDKRLENQIIQAKA